MIYLSAFMQLPDQRMPVVAGSAIGAGIGVSVGVVFYYALLSLGGRVAIMTGAFFLALVAAAMVSQSVQLLTQADWLPSQYPLWDSSWLVSEQSVTGQLLYALVGYEATPTAGSAGRLCSCGADARRAGLGSNPGDTRCGPGSCLASRAYVIGE